MDHLTQLLVALCTQHTDGLITDYQYALGVVDAGCHALTVATPAASTDALVNTYATRVH